MTSDTAITLSDVKKQYGSGPNAVHALRGVSHNFSTATFTAIMGPSGSGKSTLLQCAAGLERPTSGVITIGEQAIGQLSETDMTKLRRDHIGFVFQSFNLMPSLTASQNVALPLRIAGKRPGKEEIADILGQVGLGERANHLPSQLSGGQQQRVAIARALAAKPQVLFADEPTGALDSKAGKDILQLLRQVVNAGKQTIIMVTHDPVAASYADSVIFLSDGQLVGSLKNPTRDSVAKYITTLER